jgi:hypothetical protein
MKRGTFAGAIALWALAGLSIQTRAEIRVYRQVGSTFVQVGTPEVQIDTTNGDVSVTPTAASSDWFIGRIYDTNGARAWKGQHIA